MSDEQVVAEINTQQIATVAKSESHTNPAATEADDGRSDEIINIWNNVRPGLEKIKDRLHYADLPDGWSEVDADAKIQLLNIADRGKQVNPGLVEVVASVDMWQARMGAASAQNALEQNPSNDSARDSLEKSRKRAGDIEDMLGHGQDGLADYCDRQERDLEATAFDLEERAFEILKDAAGKGSQADQEREREEKMRGEATGIKAEAKTWASIGHQLRSPTTETAGAPKQN
jgi:hypothetical protein